MTCRRAFEADLAAVLHGEGTDADFRAHYAGCPECAAEVAVWRELDATLRAGAPALEDHPAAEELLAFADAPASLAGAARATIERHVAGCRMCADEVRTLGRADLASLLAPRGERVPARIVPPSGATEDRSWLRRLVWHPAFAYALVAALLVPVVRDQLTRVGTDRESAGHRAFEPVVAAKREAPADAGAVEGALRREERAGAPAAPEFAADSASADRRVDSLRNEAAPPAQPRAKVASAEPARQRAMAPPEVGAPARVPAEAETDRMASRVFADTLGRAAPAAPPAPVFEIGPTLPSVVPLAAAADGPRLRVMLPPSVAEGPAEVRVRARAGGGEIFQRVAVSANTIEVQMPPSWLVAGDYVVTVRPSTAPAGREDTRTVRAASEAVVGFTVRAPSAADAAR